ncbi:MAG: sel1 repeat family protein [Succinivibrio sp.]|nr:sel1 repeat family protein [Succinivibrio sp.]
MKDNSALDIQDDEVFFDLLEQAVKPFRNTSSKLSWLDEPAQDKSAEQDSMLKNLEDKVALLGGKDDEINLEEDDYVGTDETPLMPRLDPSFFEELEAEFRAKQSSDESLTLVDDDQDTASEDDEDDEFLEQQMQREYLVQEVLPEAQKGDPSSMLVLHYAILDYDYAIDDDGEHNDLALDWLRAAADRDYGLALTALGECYRQGHLVPQDVLKALKIFLYGAEQGSDMCAVQAAQMILSDEVSHQDHQLGIKLLKRAARNLHPLAVSRLADCYLHGAFVPRDVKKAEALLKRAVRKQQPTALAKLGTLYCTKDEIRDEDKGLKLLEEAVEYDEPSAAFVLAHIYGSPKSKHQDLEKSAQFMKTAAELGSAEAQCMVGLMLLGQARSDLQELIKKYPGQTEESVIQNRPYKIDPKKKYIYNDERYAEIQQRIYDGLSYLKDSAENGVIRAIHVLVDLYAHGILVVRDAEMSTYFLLSELVVKAASKILGRDDDLIPLAFSDAFLVLSKAVRDYDPEKYDSMVFQALAVCYECGIGTDLNNEMAIKTLKQGCEHNDVLSLTTLSQYYKTGHLVRKNTTKANELMARAMPLLHKQAEMGEQGTPGEVGDPDQEVNINDDFVLSSYTEQ